ncbi:MAG: efflux RND transporter periplasmic adaptor subunit [Lachnospiraceae bacterium]|jgi:RND family efflux transporter MFP subunit|nr:efflux RND transporter periplasmic adaptor subunit [Lachnospiraceae bacterium]
MAIKMKNEKVVQSQQPKVRKPMDKKKKKVITYSVLGGIALFLLAVWGVGTLLMGSIKPMVTTATVTMGDVEQVINTSGSVTTLNSKVYFAEVALPVSTIHVQSGDLVTAGDILLSFNNEAMEAERQLAELNLQSISGSYDNSVQSNSARVGELYEANTNIAVLEQQIADTEAYINDREKKISQKQADLAYHGTQLQISLQDYPNPMSEEYTNLQEQIQYNNYEQQYNKEIRAWQDEIAVANETLSGYREYLAEMKSQQSSSEASRMSAAAESELEANNQSQDIKANQTLGNLAEVEQGITAEFTGVITSVDVVEGATTMVGGQLFTLESTEEVKVGISLSKYDLEKVVVGQNANVTIGGTVYEGQVSKISRMAVPNASGTPMVAADITILNPDEAIFLGVDAKVDIHTAQVSGVVIVPVEAVNIDQEGDFIYVVENNILQKRRVVCGIASMEYVEIMEGLKEGDMIVPDLATATITEGMEVMPIPGEMMMTAGQSADGGQ